MEQVINFCRQTADGWFSKQEKTVSDAFAKMKEQYAGGFNQMKGWQEPGAPPESQTKLSGDVTSADLANNVHGNWLLDKASASASGVQRDKCGISPDNTLETPWGAFEKNMQQSSQLFSTALEKFKAAILTIINDPKSFGTVVIPNFLDMIADLINGLLTLCDAALDGFLALADAAVHAFDTLLNTRLELEPLNACGPGWRRGRGIQVTAS